MISVLIADDHSMVRSGLKHIIDEQSDMKVISEATNGVEAVEKTLELQPDVIIMDLKMPQKNGLIATEQILEQDGATKIIVLTMYDEKEYMLRILQAGALGFLLKSHGADELLDAIRAVYKGEAYLPPSATKVLIKEYANRENKGKQGGRKLSPREKEVLAYIAKGYTNKEVSEKLYVSIKTVESHRSNIMQKLNIQNRHELVKYAVQKGFMDFI